MKGCSTWSYRPYRPLNHMESSFKPYICRLAPYINGTEVQILDNGAPDSAHLLKIRPMGTLEEWRVVPMSGSTTTINDLVPWMDYEIICERANDPAACSELRFVRTGAYPGRIVNYLHPKDDLYAFSGHTLCNPCIVKMPSGTIVSCMDIYEHRAPQNCELIFRSYDRGATWEYVCDLFPCMWGTIFEHKGVLYMLATATENGDLLIGASYDEGTTWTKPVMIFPGSGLWSFAGWQRQPMPVIEYKGKLMTSIEYGCWNEPDLFGIHTLWINADADPLIAENWNVSVGTHYDKNWANSPRGGNPALLEGNLFVTPDGRVINLLRMQISNSDPAYGCACYLEVDMEDIDAAPKFDSIQEMPTGANTKTYVQYDAVSRKYWAIGNLVTDPSKPAMRNVVGLLVSDNGFDWRTVKILFDYSKLKSEEVGMQYHQFIIDGNDILWVSRTAFNQAHNYHDSNCQTFHIIADFRKLDM